MKKVLVVLAFASLILMTGCSKTCKCTASGNLGDNSAKSEMVIDLEDGKKCSDYNSSFNIGGVVGASYDCKPQLF